MTPCSDQIEAKTVNGEVLSKEPELHVS